MGVSLLVAIDVEKNDRFKKLQGVFHEIYYKVFLSLVVSSNAVIVSREEFFELMNFWVRSLLSKIQVL